MQYTAKMPVCGCSSYFLLVIFVFAIICRPCAFVRSGLYFLNVTKIASMSKPISLWAQSRWWLANNSGQSVWASLIWQTKSDLPGVSQQRHNYMLCKNILQIHGQTTDALGLSYMRAFPLSISERFEWILTFYIIFSFLLHCVYVAELIPASQAMLLEQDTTGKKGKCLILKMCIQKKMLLNTDINIRKKCITSFLLF